MKRTGLGTTLGYLMDTVTKLHTIAGLGRSRLNRGEVRDFPDGKHSVH